MKTSNGEELLLATSPVFKRRYTHDGDLLLGCRIGCKFCYYRWISVSGDYIGTGKLKRLCTPGEMIEFLKRSRLFLPEDILILGARGDASMYLPELLHFLQLVESDSYFKKNLVLALSRIPANDMLAEAFQYSCFRWGTTITPLGRAMGWTAVDDAVQLERLRYLVETGIPPSRISVEVGPLNHLNTEKGVEIIEKLGEIGFRDVIVRGVAFGSFGVDRQSELQKLLRMNFITQDMLSCREEKHEYYVIKNFLRDETFRLLQELVPDIRIHRYTYTFYRDVWGVPVAHNRGNRVRISERTHHSEERVRRAVEGYGLDVEDVEKREDHYFVRLRGQAATEDIAMTVGAELRTAVLFDRFHHTPTVEDVQFYRKNSLFYLEPYIPELV